CSGPPAAGAQAAAREQREARARARTSAPRHLHALEPHRARRVRAPMDDALAAEPRAPERVEDDAREAAALERGALPARLHEVAVPDLPREGARVRVRRELGEAQELEQ